MLSNVQSLFPKLDEFHLIISSKHPDIFCITETWLNDSIDSSLIECFGYSSCRNDRQHRRGGGTAIFIRDGFGYLHLNARKHYENVDITIVELYNNSIFLFCVYIPPQLNADQLKKTRNLLFEEAELLWSKKPNFDLIIAGDFNGFKVCDFCNDLDLTDVVKHPTRASNVLDHILVSRGLCKAYVDSNVQYNPPIATADHLTLSIIPVHDFNGFQKRSHTSSTATTESSSNPTETRWHTVHDFRQSNLDFLWYRVNLIDWDSLLNSCSDVDEMWEAFHNSTKQLFQECIPSRLVPITSRDKAWMTPLTKMLIIDK